MLRKILESILDGDKETASKLIKEELDRRKDSLISDAKALMKESTFYK